MENIEKEFDASEFTKIDGLDNTVGNDLYNKCRDAVRAGLSAAASQYLAVDSGTINPNKTEKSLTTDGNPG